MNSGLIFILFFQVLQCQLPTALLTLPLTYDFYWNLQDNIIYNGVGYYFPLVIEDQQTPCIIDFGIPFLDLLNENYCYSRCSSSYCPDFGQCFERTQCPGNCSASSENNSTCFHQPCSHQSCLGSFYETKISFLDSYQNASILTTGSGFQWGALSKLPLTSICRIGMYDYAIGDSVGKFDNIFRLLLDDYTRKVITLDLNADFNPFNNRLYLGGIPPDLDSRVVWGLPSIQNVDCDTNFQISIFDLRLCNQNLLSFKEGPSSHVSVRLSLLEQCIIFPSTIVNNMYSILQADCNHNISSSFCAISLNVTGTNIGSTVISFRLSEDGPQLFINMNTLVVFGDRLYYCLSDPARYSKEYSLNYSPYEIIFGSQVIESLYLLYDFDTQTIGFANKLVPDEFDDTSTKNTACNTSFCPAQGKCKETLQESTSVVGLACSSGSFRTYNNQVQDCDLQIFTKILFYFLSFLIIIFETLAMYNYELAFKSIEAQGIFQMN